MNDMLVNNNTDKKKQIVIIVICFLLFIILLPRVMLFISKKTGRYHKRTVSETSQNVIAITPVPSGVAFPRVSDTTLIDTSGQPFLLHGAMIESSLAYIERWKKGEDPTTVLNSNTFHAMASWRMNAVRINISEWIYELDPTAYMNILDRVVQQANASALYVILDFHDDTQGGSPYGDGMLHAESLVWWKTIAGHFKDNTMIMFDPINEPKYPDWQTWLHGNSQTVRGFQDVVEAIRSVGANQIIIVEPGRAGGDTKAGGGGWSTFSLNDVIHDQNIIYSKHIYDDIISGNSQKWDEEWGALKSHYPLYYGEWAVLPNAYHEAHCLGLTSDNAQALTTAFLQYMKNNNISWTAWDYEVGHLIQDNTTYTPTTFTMSQPWQCDSITAKKAGMGEVVKDFLNSSY